MQSLNHKSAVGGARRLAAGALGALAMFAATGSNGVLAQSYPSKPIRMVVPFPTGFASDFLARTVSQKMSELYGKQVIVDNRPGGGMSLGATVVAKAAPDGYTLFMGHPNSLTVGPALRAKGGYDPINDFDVVSVFATTSTSVAVSGKSPWRTLRELLDFSRANPRVDFADFLEIVLACRSHKNPVGRHPSHASDWLTVDLL